MKHVDSTWNILPKQPGDYGNSFINSMFTSEDGTLISQIKLHPKSKITILDHPVDTLYIDIDEAITIFCEKSKSCSLMNNSNEVHCWILLKKAL